MSFRRGRRIDGSRYSYPVGAGAGVRSGEGYLASSISKPLKVNVIVGRPPIPIPEENNPDAGKVWDPAVHAYVPLESIVAEPPIAGLVPIRPEMFAKEGILITPSEADKAYVENALREAQNLPYVGKSPPLPFEPQVNVLADIGRAAEKVGITGVLGGATRYGAEAVGRLVGSVPSESLAKQQSIVDVPVRIGGEEDRLPRLVSIAPALVEKAVPISSNLQTYIDAVKRGAIPSTPATQGLIDAINRGALVPTVSATPPATVNQTYSPSAPSVSIVTVPTAVATAATPTILPKPIRDYQHSQIF